MAKILKKAFRECLFKIAFIRAFFDYFFFFKSGYVVTTLCTLVIL